MLKPARSEPAKTEIPTKPAEQIAQQVKAALKVINDECLGYLYVLFPGETAWEKLYVIYKNCQLQFMTSIRNNQFKHSYILHKVEVRPTRKDIISMFGQDASTPDAQRLRKIDVLMLTHRYDTKCMYVTVPQIFENEYRYPEFTDFVLEKVKRIIEKSS